MMLIREFIEAIIIKLKLTLSLIACIVMFPHDLPQAQIYDFPLAIEQWSFPQKLIPDFWGSWKDSLMRDFTYTSSGDSILFVGQRYIMYSVRTDSGWSIPKVFFNYMSARGNGLVHPELHPDGKTLYFSSDINGRIWRSFYRNDSTWSHPVTFFDGGLNTLSGGYTLLNLIKAEAFFGFYGGTGLGSMARGPTRK